MRYSIPSPKSAFIDQATGLVSRDWFSYLNNVFASLGGGSNVIPIENGGTGANTAAGAQVSLGITPSNAGIVFMYPTSLPGDPSLWKVLKEDGTELSTTGTTTQGLQEAIDYAVNNGFHLVVYGQGDNIGGHSVQGAYITCTTTVTKPAMQFSSVWLINVDIDCNPGASNPGIVIDTSILSTWHHQGQVTYTGNSDAVQIKPVNFDPEDGGIFSADGEIYIQTIAAVGGTPSGLMRVSLTNGGVTGLKIRSNELNGINRSGFGFYVDGPTGGNSWIGNNVDIDHVHLTTGACVQIGVNSTNQNNLYGNTYRFGILAPNGLTADGLNSYGSNDIVDIGTIYANEGSLNDGVHLQSGSNSNQIRVGKINGQSGTVVIDGGTNNDITYNGTKHFSGTTIGAQTITGDVGINANADDLVYDKVAGNRPLIVASTDTVTTIAGSLANIVIANKSTSANNTAQLSFAALTGPNTPYFIAGAISNIFGARTSGQYPTGIMVFSISPSLNMAPTEIVRLVSTGTIVTGNVNASGGYVGTSTNDSASTGNIGEYKSSTVTSGAAISLISTSVTNVTSVVLSPGDWDAAGQVDYVAGGGAVIQYMQQGASTTSGTLPAQDGYSSVVLGATVVTDPGNPVPVSRISVSTTTTTYLITKAAFTIGTLSAYGTIRARRVR